MLLPWFLKTHLFVLLVVFVCQLKGEHSSPTKTPKSITEFSLCLCCISHILALMFSRNLQKLSVYGDTCVLQQEGLLDSSNLHQIHQGDKKINE